MRKRMLVMVLVARRLRSIAFSPDGRFLAAGEGNGDVQFWEVGTGQGVQRIDGQGYGVSQVTFSPSGALLASGAYDGVRLWDVATGQQVWVGAPDGNPHSLAFSPDGTILAAGLWDGTIQLWDVASGQEIGVVHGHKDAVQSLVFSPDGALLVSGSADGTVGMWGIGQ